MAIKAHPGETVKRSPMLYMLEHMQLVTRVTEELAQFIAVAQAGDWDAAEKLQLSISELESEADRMKQEIRHTMPRRLWMPVARADLLALVSAQDKIANTSKDIAGLMLGRKLVFPAKLEKGLFNYVDQSVQASSAALAAVRGTNDLFRGGFGDRQAQAVEKLILEVERLERQSDKQQMKLRTRLHKLEAKLEPVDTIFLYQVLVWLGDIADHAENVGHRLTLITSA